MTFVLTEEQQTIRKTARDLARERAPVTHLRALRDSRDATGFSRALWTELADLGFAGISIPDAYGGAGLGHTELGLVLEQLGRTLAPTPFVSTVALSANALLLGDNDDAKRDLLPKISEGKQIVAFAHEEGTHHAPHAIETRVDGGALSGAKSFVLDGHVADQLVVVARDGDELGLFLVPANADGVAIERLSIVDSRNAARVRLDGAKPTARIGGAAALDATLDRATIALAAEMLGGMQEVFDQTLAYLKTREQFGVPIGSFQALKHRAATVFCEIELTKSIVAYALRAIDEGRDDLPALASTAKARANDTFMLAANEAVQMHGGVGVTDELDIGFFLKRARVAEMTLGTSSYHRDRYARLHGY